MALGGPCDLGFIVIIGDCCHLPRLVLMKDHAWKGLLVIVAASGHWLVSVFVLIPAGDS